MSTASLVQSDTDTQIIWRFIGFNEHLTTLGSVEKSFIHKVLMVS